MRTEQKQNSCRLAILFFAAMVLGDFAIATDRYVALTGGHISPYTNWAGAATGIQYAINVCSSGDVVLVMNGTYYENITIGTGVVVKSANNNPANTIINGNYPVITNRCVTMAPNSWLMGFTVTNGYCARGGGISGGSASNCIITGNTASDFFSGAGAYNSTLYNCIVSKNVAGGGAIGGGILWCIAHRCVIINNTATTGGGASESTLYNCLVVSNSAYHGGGIDGNPGTIYNCTITRNTANTGGAIYNGEGTYVNLICWSNTPTDTDDAVDPLFVSAGDFHLQSNSPCINTGTNVSWMEDASDIRSHDLDGNKRIWPSHGTADKGAYEYESQQEYMTIFIFCGRGVDNMHGTSLDNVHGKIQQ